MVTARSPEVRCAGCGHTPPPDEATGPDGIPWTWSVGTDDGRRTALCADCIREHARSIEAKLDVEWW